MSLFEATFLFLQKISAAVGAESITFGFSQRVEFCALQFDMRGRVDHNSAIRAVSKRGGFHAVIWTPTF